MEPPSRDLSGNLALSFFWRKRDSTELAHPPAGGIGSGYGLLQQRYSNTSLSIDKQDNSELYHVRNTAR
jgi:hypothetical protein